MRYFTTIWAIWTTRTLSYSRVPNQVINTRNQRNKSITVCEPGGGMLTVLNLYMSTNLSRPTCSPGLAKKLVDLEQNVHTCSYWNHLQKVDHEIARMVIWISHEVLISQDCFDLLITSRSCYAWNFLMKVSKLGLSTLCSPTRALCKHTQKKAITLTTASRMRGTKCHDLLQSKFVILMPFRTIIT